MCKWITMVFLVFAFGVCAQEARLLIDITDGKAGIGYASVGIAALKKGGVADEKGSFKMDVLAGTHKLKASAIGYLSEVKVITVNAGESVHLTMVLKQDPSALNEVTISGTMKETGKMNSPVPVEIYTPKFFLKNPTSGMFEALTMVNGVQPTINCNVCNTGDIHLNGMEGPYTMVLIDGMPIVSALSTVYGLSGIPNAMIDRIEIVKGPASTLYGSEAVAGLINVITKRTDKAPSLSADVFATGMGEWNADLGFSLKRKKYSTLTGFNLASSQMKWDVNNDHFTDMTLFDRFSVFNKWTFKGQLARESSIAWRYYHENRFGGELEFTPALRGSDQVYGESIFTDRMEWIGQYRLPVNENIKLMYSYNFHKQDAWYGRTPFNATQQVGFAQLIWNREWKQTHDVLTGICMRYTWYDDNTPATSGIDTLHPSNQPIQRWLPGLFVQDEIRLNGKTSLLLGIRYDNYKDHGSILSPRANLKFKPDTYTTLRLSAGNGFRVVNLFTEDHQALTGARTVVITEDLKPEKSWNVNVNVVRIIPISKALITIDASAFYTRFTNRIMADYDTDPALIIYSNLNGYAVSKGFSLNTDFSLPPSITASTGITIMEVYKTELFGGKEIRTDQIHAPKFMAVFQFTWAPPKWPVKLDYSGQVYGPMRLPVVPNDYRPEYSPWFTLQHLQMTYTFKSRWQLYGGIKNIFNFLPADPILRPFDPFNRQILLNNPNGYQFDPSYNYAPMQGRRAFVGLRYTLK